MSMLTEDQSKCTVYFTVPGSAVMVTWPHSPTPNSAVPLH